MSYLVEERQHCSMQPYNSSRISADCAFTSGHLFQTSCCSELRQSFSLFAPASGSPDPSQNFIQPTQGLFSSSHKYHSLTYSQPAQTKMMHDQPALACMAPERCVLLQHRQHENRQPALSPLCIRLSKPCSLEGIQLFRKHLYLHFKCGSSCTKFLAMAASSNCEHGLEN